MDHAARHIRELPSRILDRAETLCVDGYAEHAIIAAQSACELACEQVIHAAIVAKELAYMQSSLDALISSYNLSAEKTRGVYNALADDSIQDCSFWHRYKELVNLRNHIVHRGDSASSETARPLIAVARQLVTHVMQRADRIRAEPQAESRG